MGPLINKVIDLSFMLGLPGAAVTWADMTHEEYTILRLLKSEQDRYTEEKRKEFELEMQRRQQQQAGRRR